MHYLLKELSAVTGGHITGEGKSTIRELITDSRTIPASPDSMFVALKGPHYDGHRFIPDLIKKGIHCFMVGKMPEDTSGTATFLVVPDTLVALQNIAQDVRNHFNKPVIGITGSNGKTIVKEWLFQLLNPSVQVVRSPKSYNSQVGVPLSVLLLEDSAGIAIFEAGISKPGEMEKLERIIRPTIGIFTNIGESHQENFTSLEQKVQEKLQLFRHAKKLIYCSDHTLIDELITRTFATDGPELLSWSRSKKATLQITAIQKEMHSTCIQALWNNQQISVTIPFNDEASIENAIHCWLTMLSLHTEPSALPSLFEALSPVAMRLELITGIHNCSLINDSYNSDLASLTIALDFLQQQNQNRRKTVILSDILQSGRNEEELYHKVADLLETRHIDKLVGIGPALLRNRKSFNLKSSFFPSTEAFLESNERESFYDETILLKGARIFGFERITELLEEKRHLTRLEISLNAMAYNLNYFRSLLRPETRIMVMVKALSYGTGTYEIANMLQFQKVDYLAVANTDEGVSLRHAGISTPIMVVTPEPHSFDTMLRHELEPEIYSLPVLRSFIAWAARQGVRHYPVHLKLDTGMHRLGFMQGDLEELCRIIENAPEIKIKSIFSHLAGSDDPALDDFTHQQIDLFRDMSTLISKHLSYPVLRHILNSSGIERFPEAQFDMVRLGIGLYGISVIHQERLQPIGTLCTVISQVKTIPAGETVGYNRKGKIARETKIAVIPIGYADGLNRRLGNGVGKFWVKGKLAPIIGNLCMDMCMIDVTGIPATEGDKVIIFGEKLPVTDLAKAIGTIPYEILTGISSRVKRVYFQE